MTTALDHVLDALDIETFLVCSSEEEGRRLAVQLMADLGLPHGDVVFLEYHGSGARVRLRSYLHRPGDHYRWLESESEL